MTANENGIAFFVLMLVALVMMYRYWKKAEGRDPNFRVGLDVNKKEDVVTIYFLFGFIVGAVIGISIHHAFETNILLSLAVGVALSLFAAFKVIASVRKDRIVQKIPNENHQR